MAKLMALVFVAGWLMVGLAVILCTTPAPTKTGWQQRAAGLFLNAEKTRGQWADWRDDCVKALRDFHTACENKPEYSRRQPCPWLISGINWLKKLNFVPEGTDRNEKFKTDCHEKLEDDLLSWKGAIAKPLVFSRFVRAYLKLYLNACGAEEGFQKAIANGENLAPNWKSMKSLTLYRYIKQSLNPTELDNLVSYSRVTFELDNNYQKIGCTQYLRKVFLYWLAKSASDENWHKRVKDHFFVYLNKCGFEARFKKVIDNTGLDASSRWKTDLPQTLSDYFGLWKTFDESTVSFILLVIDKLSASASTTRQTYCDEAYMLKLVEWIRRTDKLLELQSLLYGYFALYLDKCGLEKRFKKVIDNTELDASLRWEPDLPRTLSSYFKLKPMQEWWNVDDMLYSIAELSETVDMSRESYCDYYFNQRKLPRMVYNMGSHPGLNHILSGYFLMYLNKCGFEQSFKERIGNMQPDQDDNKTLFSFMNRKYHHHSMKIWLLSAIGKLSRGSISRERDCTNEFKTNIIEWLIDGRDDQYSDKAMKGYFALYLDQCGFEEQFEKVINKLAPISGNHWDSAKFKTLLSYLVSKDWKQSELEWILSSIEKVSELANVSREGDCTTRLMQKLSGMLSESEDLYPDLHVLLGEYEKFYKNLCGPSFVYV